MAAEESAAAEPMPKRAATPVAATAETPLAAPRGPLTATPRLGALPIAAAVEAPAAVADPWPALEPTMPLKTDVTGGVKAAQVPMSRPARLTGGLV